MAAQRPAVEIIREFQPTVAAVATPVLESLIIGPAYHIQDYPADAATIGVGDYGDSTSDSDGSTNGRPLPGAPTIVVAEPPGNVVGAVLDASSVQVYFDSVYAELITGSDGTTQPTTAPDEDVFFTQSTVVDFAAAGVRPGDRLVITDDAPATPFTVVKIVQEVGGYNGSTLNSYELRTYTNIVEAGLTVPGNTAYKYRIERALSDIAIDSAFVDVSGNSVTIYGGITTNLDVDGDGVDEVLPINYGDAYIAYASLRQDLAALTQIEDTDEISTDIGRVDERNPLAVAAQVALLNTTTPIYVLGVTGDNLNGASDRITAYSSALDGIETRTDIYAIAPLANELALITSYKNSAEALALPAVSNFRMILGSTGDIPTDTEISADSATGFAEFVATDPIDIFASTDGNFETNGAQEDDVLHIVTGSADTALTISAAIDDDRLYLSDPAGGVAQSTALWYVLRGTGGLVADLGAVRLATGPDTVADPDAQTANQGYVGQIITLAKPGGAGTYDGDYLVTAATDGVQSTQNTIGTNTGLTYTARQAGVDGDSITIEYDATLSDQALSVDVTGTAITVYLETIASVVQTDEDGVRAAIEADVEANSLVIVSGTSATTAAAGGPASLAGGADTFYNVTGGAALGVASDHNATVHSTVTTCPSSGGATPTISAADYTTRRALRRLLDNSATFLSGATPVIVSDLMEVPIPVGAGNSDYTDTVASTTVAQLLGDNRLLMALGDDIRTADPLSTTDAQSIAHYRIARSLDKAGQVDELVSITETLKSEQLVMVWPDAVLVEGVKNASTGIQSAQPGYYLAAALAGMSAGLPSHQGLTNVAVAGIERLYNSNTYFSAAQIDELSSGGWYVFVQDTPSSPPYSIHQLTTDTTTLDSGEFSMVRNYHFVAKTYKDALDDFLGRYNVIPETLETLANTMRVVGNTLRRGRLPRIGSPILSAQVLSIETAEGSRDQVEIQVAIEFPAPLNRIILRIQG